MKPVPARRGAAWSWQMAALCALMVFQTHLLASTREGQAPPSPGDVPAVADDNGDRLLTTVPLSTLYTCLIRLDATPRTPLTDNQRECLRDLLREAPDLDAAMAGFRATVVATLRDDQCAWLLAAPMVDTRGADKSSPFRPAITTLAALANVPAESVPPSFSPTTEAVANAHDLSAENLNHRLPAATNAPPSVALSHAQARALLGAYRAYGEARLLERALKLDLASILEPDQRAVLLSMIEEARRAPSREPANATDAAAVVEALNAPRQPPHQQ